MEKFELEEALKEEIRARVLGEGFMKIVQSVRRGGKTFRISMRPVSFMIASMPFMISSSFVISNEKTLTSSLSYVSSSTI